MAREIASRGRKYHQRVKIETVLSVEKRLMGSHVLARGTCQQHKELIFRAFSYNSRRLETLFLLFIEGFHRAQWEEVLNTVSGHERVVWRKWHEVGVELLRQRMLLSCYSHCH